MTVTAHSKDATAAQVRQWAAAAARQAVIADAEDTEYLVATVEGCPGAWAYGTTAEDAVRLLGVGADRMGRSQTGRRRHRHSGHVAWTSTRHTPVWAATTVATVSVSRVPTKVKSSANPAARTMRSTVSAVGDLRPDS